MVDSMSAKNALNRSAIKKGLKRAVGNFVCLDGQRLLQLKKRTAVNSKRINVSPKSIHNPLTSSDLKKVELTVVLSVSPAKKNMLQTIAKNPLLGPGNGIKKTNIVDVISCTKNSMASTLRSIMRFLKPKVHVVPSVVEKSLIQKSSNTSAWTIVIKQAKSGVSYVIIAIRELASLTMISNELNGLLNTWKGIGE